MSLLPIETLVGLYVHVPFCRRRCAYCDFVSMELPVSADRLRDRYIDVVLHQMEQRCAGVVIDTVYVGGGTPTVLGGEGLSRLLGGIHERVAVAPDAEWTVEANPESLDDSMVAAIFDSGVTRVSIGIQSFDDETLAILGRIHDAAGAIDAVERATAVGSLSVSIDLLFGTPDRNGGNVFVQDLDLACALGVDHVSCYALTPDTHTPLGHALADGQLRLPDVDSVREQYDVACGRLGAAGFVHYEVSNWAQPGRECRHNERYWDRRPYIGVGPSAHSFNGARRSWERADVEEWMTGVEAGDSVVGEDLLTDAEVLTEQVYLGLRTSSGILPDRLLGESGSRDRRRLDTLSRAGIVQRRSDGSYVLDDATMFVMDRVVLEVIDTV